MLTALQPVRLLQTRTQQQAGDCRQLGMPMFLLDVNGLASSLWAVSSMPPMSLFLVVVVVSRCEFFL